MNDNNKTDRKAPHGATASTELKVFQGAFWLGFFKFFSQVLSWVITIAVARILVPGDYGLSAMATIVTSYAELFCELGLGAAIIQRTKITQKELSSIFWFAFFVSCLFALICFPVSYITAGIFLDDRVIPLTQSISVIFILSGLTIVPLNILKKDLDFKKIGAIEMVTTVISCLGMLLIADLGGGVWALIGGRIIRSFLRLVLVFWMTKWTPTMFFSLAQIKPHINFGLKIATGRSLFYVSETSDRFFVGRAWGAQFLGYYSFALQLAQIPTEKIVSLINQVAYPGFAQLQNEKERFNRLYLNIVKVTACLVFPIFVGAFIVGDAIIMTFLNEQWRPIIYFFNYLCLAQILTSLNAINNFVHDAQGRPYWSMRFNFVGAIFLPISFYVATQYTHEAVIIPWFTTYAILCVAWTIITIRHIGVGVFDYMANLMNPIIATAVMVAGLVAYRNFFSASLAGDWIGFILAEEIAVAAFIYVGYFLFFDKAMIYNLKKLRSA